MKENFQSLFWYFFFQVQGQVFKTYKTLFRTSGLCLCFSKWPSRMLWKVPEIYKRFSFYGCWWLRNHNRLYFRNAEIEGGSMFATSYCLTFNFHPKLEMTLITCLRSFGKNEDELKFITIPHKPWPYTDHDDLLGFKDGCDVVLEKTQKQAISTLCMI